MTPRHVAGRLHPSRPAAAMIIVALAAWSIGAVAPPSAFAQAPKARAAGSAEALPATQHAYAAQGGNEDVQVRTWADRTAVWVGDIITYHVELQLAPNVDVLADDLARDKVKTTGFTVIGSDERPPAVSPTGRTTRHFAYALASYDINVPTLSVDDFTIRYYARRRGQRVEDATPAGQITVPGVAVGFRSTLPDEIKTLQARDLEGAAALPRYLALVRPVGIGLLLVSVLPVALWAISLLRRLTPLLSRVSFRRRSGHAQSALEELKMADTSSDARRLEAYTALEALVRRHVAEATGLMATALTADELGMRLEAARSRVPAETVRELLAECEQARYGSPRHLPGRDQFEAALISAQQVLQAR